MPLPLPLLLAILIAALPRDPWDAAADSAASVGWWMAAVLGGTAAACLAAAWRARRLLAAAQQPWEQFARRYLALRFATLTLLLGGFWWVSGPARFAAYVSGPELAGWPDTARVGLVLAPYMAGAWIRRLAFSRLEAQLRGPGATGLGGELRGAALVVVPMAALLLVLDLAQAIGPLRRLLEAYPTSHWVLLGLPGVVLLLFGASWLLRAAWPTRPLPPGPLRDRLESLCRQSGFRCRDLRLWETSSSRVMNAAVTGLLPRWRTVFLTVPLLRRLGRDQLDAVLAHEIAHARRAHALFYLLLGAGFVGWLLAVEDWAARAWGNESAAYLAALLGLGVVYWGGWFGVVSRRFERQADLDGAATVGSPEAMAGALEKVAAVAGQARSRRQWRHGSIASRVAAVRAAAVDPVIRRRMHRAARWAAWSGPVLLVAGWLAMVPPLRVEWATGSMRRAAWRGDLADARRWYASAAAVRPPGPGVHEAWGEVCEEAGRLAEARAAYRSALAAARTAGDARRLTARIAELSE